MTEVLEKSLQELDALVDDILSKADKTEKVEKSEEAKAEEIVEDTPKVEEQEETTEEDSKEDETKEEPSKDNEEDAPPVEKSKKVKKSEEEAPIEVAETADEEVEKCDTTEEVTKAEEPTEEVEKAEEPTEVEEEVEKCEEPTDEVEKCEEPTAEVTDEEVTKSEDTTEEVEEDELDKSLADATSVLNSILFESQNSYKELNKSIDTLSAKIEGVDTLTKSMDDISSKLDTFSDTMVKSMQVSDTKATALTEVIAKSLKVIIDANKRILDENKALKKSIADIQEQLTSTTANESINKSIGELTDIVNNLVTTQEQDSHQPARVRKSFQGQALERDFSASRGEVADELPLSKSEISDILTQELISGSQIVKSEDIISFESGAPLRASIKQLLKNKLK